MRWPSRQAADRLSASRPLAVRSSRRQRPRAGALRRGGIRRLTRLAPPLPHCYNAVADADRIARVLSPILNKPVSGRGCPSMIECPHFIDGRAAWSNFDVTSESPATQRRSRRAVAFRDGKIGLQSRHAPEVRHRQRGAMAAYRPPQRLCARRAAPRQHQPAALWAGRRKRRFRANTVRFNEGESRGRGRAARYFRRCAENVRGAVCADAQGLPRHAPPRALRRGRRDR